VVAGTVGLSIRWKKLTRRLAGARIFSMGNLQRLADRSGTLKRNAKYNVESTGGFMDFHGPDSLNCEFDPSDHNKVLELLTQRIAHLPRISKKVLALYYYENLRLAEIATGLGLTESEIELIRTQTVRLLQNKIVDDLKQSE
jgi:DNA-directed RNA polymerase specialized sigma24 family protein